MREGDPGVEALHVANLEDETGLPHLTAERLAFLDGHAQRLLDQHVLPRRQRFGRRRDVELIGNRDDDGIDVRVGEQLIVVSVRHVRLVDERHPFEQVFGEVADGVELGISRAPARLEVRCLGDRPAAEYADSQRLSGRHLTSSGTNGRGNLPRNTRLGV
jgi:hypothetical protein